MFALTIFVVKISIVQLLKYYLTWHFYNKFTIGNAYKVAKLIYYYNNKKPEILSITTTEEVKVQKIQKNLTLINNFKNFSKFLYNKIKKLFYIIK